MAYAAAEGLQLSSKLCRAWPGSSDDVVTGMAVGGKMTLGSEDWSAVASWVTGTC